MTDKVVPLGRDPEPQPPVVPSRPKRLQAIAIGGMTSFAIVGFLALLSLFTIGSFSGDTRRYVVIVVVFSAVGFLASASAAVLTAAGNTYESRPERDGD
ncbi:MAG: hypothetical protein ACR2LG_13925 [Actinomycetota bacterium]|nr:hypothetical protein [Actinomycetota bacterium]